jgi:hypothetical protein
MGKIMFLGVFISLLAIMMGGSVQVYGAETVSVT